MYELAYQLSVSLFHLTPVTFLFVALVVWYSRNKQRYHIYWILFSLLTAFAWTNAVLLTLYVKDPNIAKVLGRLAITFGCMGSFAYYSFVLSYLNLEESHKRSWRILLVYEVVLFLGFVFTNSFYAGVTKGAGGLFQPKPGPMMGLYLPFVMYAFGSGLWYSRKAYKQSSGQKKLQLRYFHYASWVVLFAAIGSLFPYSQARSFFVWLPSALTVLYPIVVSYIIIRHRLWDIRTVFHKTLLWIIISACSLAPIYILLEMFVPFVQENQSLLPILTASLYVLVLLLINRVQPKIDELFARRRFGQDQVIDEFIEDIRHLQHIKPLAMSLHQTLQTKLKASSSRLLLREEKTNALLDVEDVSTPPLRFALSSTTDSDEDSVSEEIEPEASDDSSLPEWSYHWLLQFDQSIDSSILGTTELPPHHQTLLLDAMAERQAEVWVPLLHNNRWIGLIELGEKNNYKAYTLEDFQLLERIRSAAEVAVSNARLYQELQSTTEELRGLTASLEERVEQRTNDLATAKKDVEEAYQKLQRADEARTRFFTNITHELRTPLTLILAPLEDQLQRKDELPPDLPPTHQLMHRQAIHLYSLINDLLDLAQLDADQLRLRVREFSPQERFTSMVSAFTSLAKRKKIQFNVDIPTNLPMILGDPDKLDRVFINLLGNAIKFTPRGGEVSLRLLTEDDFFVGEVIDNGIGIPHEQQARIFDRFAQVQEGDDRAYEGSGIGLSLVWELVQRHGGTIEVESEPGEGALFRIRLPLSYDAFPSEFIERRQAHVPTEHARRSTDADPLQSFQVRSAVAAGHSLTARNAPDAQPTGPLLRSESSDSLEPLPAVQDLSPSSPNLPDTSQRSRSGTSYPSLASPGSHPELLLAESIGESRTIFRLGPDAPYKPQEKLLIVEDNSDMQSYLQGILSPYYELTLANNGVQALKLLEEMHPDLILSDVMMPKMSGYELCERVKSNATTASIPVILLTAKQGHEPAIEGFQMGADDYVVKPFNSRELLARIQVQLRLTQMAQQLALQEKVSLMGLLSGGLAHEVKNPANAAINAIAPIRKMLNADDPKSKQSAGILLDLVEESVDRITRLSDDLLGLAGSTSEGLVHWNIQEALEKTRSLLLHQHPKAVDIHALFHHDDEMVGLLSQLNQLLLNLLSNALNATEQGGTVEIETSSSPDKFWLIVRDTGTGIAPEALPRIFDPLYTTAEVGQGTGLGLYLVRCIANNHKGEITVQSRRGQGTTVTVLFPLQPPTSTAYPATLAQAMSPVLSKP